MTISQFLELNPSDISKMNFEERKAVVDEMSKKANRRLDRLSKLPLPTPAFINRADYDERERENPSIIRNEDGSFRYHPFQSTGKNSNQLANEIKYLRSFFDSPTSTVTGAKKSIMRLYGNLVKTDRTGYNVNDIAQLMPYEKTKTFWEAYSKILQTNAGVITQKRGVTPGYVSSSQVQAYIYRQMADQPDLTPDEIEAMSRKFIREVYEENVGKPRSAREYTTGRSRRNRKS